MGAHKDSLGHFYTSPLGDCTKEQSGRSTSHFRAWDSGNSQHSSSQRGERKVDLLQGSEKPQICNFALSTYKVLAVWFKPEFALVYTNVRKQSKHHHSLAHHCEKAATVISCKGPAVLQSSSYLKIIQFSCDETKVSEKVCSTRPVVQHTIISVPGLKCSTGS